MNRVVDLIFEEDDGQVTVLDWKTDRLEGRDPEEQAGEHRQQLSAYARGVGRAMGTGVPRALVHFLRGGMTVDLALES